MSDVGTAAEFEGLLDLLKRARGFDFTGYKLGSLMRRVQRRMQSVGAATYGAYMKAIESDPAECERLFDTILINVTTFFRDEIPWDYLADQVIPTIMKRKGEAESIRIWSAGCATGQEPYTLAIVLAETLGADQFLRRVKIYATDLDESALAYARQGSYTAKEVSGVPESLRERYFERHNGRHLFRKQLRRSVIFGRNDLVEDAPISRIDLLVCRNTLMYFDAQTQRRVLNRFHFALRDGGFLFLGKAETISSYAGIFEPVDLERRVFAKIHSAAKRQRASPPRTDGDGGNREALERELVSTAAFDRSPVAQFVIDARGQLALANERARQLFRLAQTDLGRAVQDLELSYRPLELRSLLDQMQHEARPIRVSEVPWELAGEERWFDVHLLPLYNSVHELIGIGISFDDITISRGLKVELQRSHTALETAYEELQSTNEELETTNEELQSTVEELETTNEELQSSNEELETMNEELQSTNEELGYINEELRRRGAMVDDLNSFLRTLFASLGGGVAVVDRDLRVKVWNHMAEELWGLRAEEVVGRPLTGLDIGLPLREVLPLIAKSFKDGKKPQGEVSVAAVNRRGKKIACRVTVNPLVEPDQKRTRGVILMMEEATS